MTRARISSPTPKNRFFAKFTTSSAKDWLSGLFSKFRDHLGSWSFTRYERQALLLFATLVLIGSSYRYYQHRSIARRIEIWHGESARMDSLAVVDREATSAMPVNINSADEKRLRDLPGIGPVLATRILDYRREHGNFRSISDLDNVPGIGPALLEKIHELISIDSSAASAH